MAKKDERLFSAVVDTIESAETDVDAVLKAARLERHEKRRFDAEDICMMIACALPAVLMLVIVAAMVLSVIR